MTLVVTRRFPGRSRRRFDSAAAVLGNSRGMGGYKRRKGMGSLSPLGQAISQAEGYGLPGAVPTIANNPGNLELGDIGYGTTTAAGGQQITNFPTLAAGQNALMNQINLISTGQSKAGYTPDMTLAQVGQLYSGGSSNWANNVASALGVSTDTNFASLAGQSTSFSSPASTSQSFTDSLDDSSGINSPSDFSSLLTSPVAIVGGLAAVAALAYAFSD